MKRLTRLRGTLRQRLLATFALMTLLPLLLNVVLSFRNDRAQILSNRDQIAQMDVQQIVRDLDMELSAYEDVLYQLYTDEELSEMVTQLDQGVEPAVTRNQIRRKLRSVFWLQDYIASITIITKTGETAFYDRLSFSSQTNVSLQALNLSPKLLFEGITAQNGTTYLPTRYATFFNGQRYDLFYMGHRVLAEQINHTDAVLIMGIDAQLFEEVLSRNWLGPQRHKYMFILNRAGQVVWFPERDYIGLDVPQAYGSTKDFIARTNPLESRELAMYYGTSTASGWEIFSVLDCTVFTKAIDQRLILTVVTTLLSFGVVVALVLVITGHLMRSVHDVCDTMRTVSHGDLSVRAACPPKMPAEIRSIAEGLNAMADRLQDLVRDREESAEKIKNAEIAALEAQLNPHFLYNTLDTLNWMAIEAEQYPISNVLSALGKTLRYGIDYSNSIVTMADEAAWLKQYLFIHQNRLQSSFRCQLDIPPEVLECRVHKLFLQPFVENAMIHGFAQGQEDCFLHIQMALSEDRLHIEIFDNGTGIPQQVLDQLSISQSRIDRSKRYHGMQNAINRLVLYYGERADISVESGEGMGTRIRISIPPRIGEEA